jgi:hypothetical protein
VTRAGAAVEFADFDVTVEAGAVDRQDTLVAAGLPEGRLDGGAVMLIDDEVAIPAQYHRADGLLYFVVPGALAAGSRRRFRAVRDVPLTAPREVAIIPKLDRLLITVGAIPFAAYNFAGARRPYFWPLLGPSGASVVRGQGDVDHPHHGGLAIAYGGHAEGGSTNIYSDWDEAPFGPGGRMLHRGFRSVSGGPVFGEVVQDLTYVDAEGDPILQEVRRIRTWWASLERRFIELTCEASQITDRGMRPFLTTIRLANAMQVPQVGQVTNATGVLVDGGEDGLSPRYRAEWVDGSGPLGPETDDWNGIAILDHPANAGFPGEVGLCAVAQQLNQHVCPPDGSDAVTFRKRIFVHAGDATAGAVAGEAAGYASPGSARVGALGAGGPS